MKLMHFQQAAWVFTSGANSRRPTIHAGRAKFPSKAGTFMHWTRKAVDICWPKWPANRWRWSLWCLWFWADCINVFLTFLLIRPSVLHPGSRAVDFLYVPLSCLVSGLPQHMRAIATAEVHIGFVNDTSDTRVTQEWWVLFKSFLPASLSKKTWRRNLARLAAFGSTYKCLED